MKKQLDFLAKHAGLKAFALTLVMVLSLLPLLPVDANAASYPTIYPEHYSYTVSQGEVLEIKFSIFREYKNERAYLFIHKDEKDGPVVAEAEHSFGSGGSSLTEYTVTWDTSDVAVGHYEAEYYMRFYTVYEWHEVPNHYYFSIDVVAPPCPNGHSFDGGAVTKEANCVSTGVKTYTCTVCGTTKTENIPVTSHSWDSGTVTTEPSALGGGKKTFACVNCGTTRTEDMAALFSDVSPDAYYAPAVEWAYQKGITTGTGAGFAPDTVCSRGQVVTFLWRAKGSPEPVTTQNPFVDVPADQYYYKAVLWAVEEGITSGTSQTTFSPDAICSNAEILTFLWRTQDKPDFSGEGEWYADAVNWATKNALLADTSAATDIAVSCPRADIVTFLYRVLKDK